MIATLSFIFFLLGSATCFGMGTEEMNKGMALRNPSIIISQGHPKTPTHTSTPPGPFIVPPQILLNLSRTSVPNETQSDEFKKNESGSFGQGKLYFDNQLKNLSNGIDEIQKKFIELKTDFALRAATHSTQEQINGMNNANIQKSMDAVIGLAKEGHGLIKGSRGAIVNTVGDSTRKIWDVVDRVRCGQIEVADGLAKVTNDVNNQQVFIQQTSQSEFNYLQYIANSVDSLSLRCNNLGAQLNNQSQLNNQFYLNVNQRFQGVAAAVRKQNDFFKEHHRIATAKINKVSTQLEAILILLAKNERLIIGDNFLGMEEKDEKSDEATEEDDEKKGAEDKKRCFYRLRRTKSS